MPETRSSARKLAHPCDLILQGISRSLERFEEDDIRCLKDHIELELQARLKTRIEFESAIIKREKGAA